MRILSPQFTEHERKEIAESNKDDWKFLLQKKLGKANHVYFNENLYDTLNNVNTYMFALPAVEQYNIKVETMYFVIKIVKSEDLGNVIYIYDIDKQPDGNTYSILKQHVVEGVTFNMNLKKSLLKTLLDNKLYFKSAYIREMIIKVITR